MQRLPDLQIVAQECAERLQRFDAAQPVILSDDTSAKIVEKYSASRESETLTIVGGHTFQIQTPQAKEVSISVQELPRCWAYIPYLQALNQYDQVIDEIMRQSGIAKSAAPWPNLPSNDWLNESGSAGIEATKQAARQLLKSPVDLELLDKFLSDGDWSGVNKKLNRADWVSSALIKTGGWLVTAAERRADFVAALAASDEIEQKLEAELRASQGVKPKKEALAKRITGAQNILYYGAPGTGKSHEVQQVIGTSKSFVTVFHPDMQNSDFVGSLKPGMNEKGGVTYAFRPGPFARALAYAQSNPSEKVYLVVEELNRAVAAAVFGELFQLLDRIKDGSGRYSVDFPSPEFEAWFGVETNEMPLVMSGLSLPSNLWILATMNSADQGVFPLDTAFRRRWVQRYVAIDYENAPDVDLKCFSISGSINISWKAFVASLNQFLVSELEIGEDRLLGPRFIEDHEFLGGALPGKLLIYLWDDLLRHHGRNELFADGIKTYGEIDRRSKTNEPIFSTKFLSILPGENEPAALDEN